MIVALSGFLRQQPLNGCVRTVEATLHDPLFLPTDNVGIIGVQIKKGSARERLIDVDGRFRFNRRFFPRACVLERTS